VFAAIDVGTNTTRLLIGEITGGKISPQHYFRRITRLGGGFDPERGLSEPAMQRTLAVLREFSDILAATPVAGTLAVATEALRRAPNAHDFLSRVRSECDFDLRVIPGEFEAQLSLAGVLSVLDPRPENLLIFDIGGGSTEFILVAGETPIFSRSYPLGTVMLCEHHPGVVARQAHIDRTLRALHDDLGRSGIPYPLPRGILPVGTAGTVTTLAALDMGMTNYDWRKVNNHLLDAVALEKLQELLEPLGVEQREALPGMEKGRGDLILPGLEIVLSILDFCGSHQMAVSDFGLLEGALFKVAASTPPP